MTNASPQQLPLITDAGTYREQDAHTDWYGKPYHADLPVKPYANKAPRVKGSETSAAAAEAIEPKLGTKQAVVLLALDKHGPLTDEALTRVCGWPPENPARPRRRELTRSGFVRDSGDRCIGGSGLYQTLWCLTDKGERKAKELQA